jgi:hypothetical protein
MADFGLLACLERRRTMGLLVLVVNKPMNDVEAREGPNPWVIKRT